MSENKKPLHVVNRKKTRKFLFQKLYALSFGEINDANFDESFFDEVFDFDLDSVYLKEMQSLIVENEQTFLYIIKLLAPKFKIETMSLSYILPIMIGACEMLYLIEEIPGKVSINESVELAKVYGDDSSKKIVNGVMNKLYKGLDGIKSQLETVEYKNNFSLFQK